MKLNSTFIADLQKRSDKCGFTNYFEKYATYPPKGPLPLPSQAYTGIPNYANITEECDTWGLVYEAAITINPNFNV